MTRSWTEFGVIFDKISHEPSIRVVVLASALSKYFSAGIDRKPSIEWLIG